MRILKYALALGDEVHVRLPEGAEVLTVGAQDNVLQLWTLVDPAEKVMAKRTFRIAGTGHEIAEGHQKRYIGTAFTHGGSLVWHVFECLPDF